jgi:hypothetical protein
MFSESRPRIDASMSKLILTGKFLWYYTKKSKFPQCCGGEPLILTGQVDFPTLVGVKNLMKIAIDMVDCNRQTSNSTKTAIQLLRSLNRDQNFAKSI